MGNEGNIDFRNCRENVELKKRISRTKLSLSQRFSDLPIVCVYIYIYIYKL